MVAVNDYIIIRQDHANAISHGIILPNRMVKTANSVGEPYTGVVESIGDMVDLVKVDDRVVFSDLAQPWIIEDKTDVILIIKQTDIIGILEDEQ